MANIRLALGYIFIISLLSLVAYSAMIYRLDNIVNQREDSFIEVLKVGLKKFPSMILGVILYTLAIIIGLILLVVPGIILSLSLSLYLYPIVLDSLGGYASLKASHQLVWGHWWRTATVYLVPSIVMIIFNYNSWSPWYLFWG